MNGGRRLLVRPRILAVLVLAIFASALAAATTNDTVEAYQDVDDQPVIVAEGDEAGPIEARSAEPAIAASALSEVCRAFGLSHFTENYLWNASESEMRVQASNGVVDFLNTWTPDSWWNFARLMPDHRTDGWIDAGNEPVCDLDYFWAKKKIRIHEPVCVQDVRNGHVGCKEIEWQWKKTLGAKKWHKVQRHWRYITCFSGTKSVTDNTILRCFAAPFEADHVFAGPTGGAEIDVKYNPLVRNPLKIFDRAPTSWGVPEGRERKATHNNETTCPPRWSRCPT